jgi:dolichol-phosphate mannosyltransferase
MPVIRDGEDAPTLSIVLPVYGCAACLEQLHDRCVAALAGSGERLEFVFVDDASPDGAWQRIVELGALHPHVRGIRLARNFGQHYAIAAGVEAARGRRVVVMDCDLQDRPEEIPRLLARADEGFEVVFAGREDRQDPPLKRFASFAFYKVLGYLTGMPQDHSTANFGVYSRKVVDTINRMPESDRVFPLMVKWTGFRSDVVPVRHDERGTGRSGYHFGKLIRLALNIVLSYSDKPLRLVVKAGLAFSMVSFLIVGLSVYRYFAGDIAVAGFTSIIASIWLLGGIIIVCIGVLGLYLGRLFNIAKGRPYYLVDERVNFLPEPANRSPAIVRASAATSGDTA